MKQILIVLMLLLLPWAAGAGPVKAERAAAVADRFFNGNATKAGARALTLVWRGEKPSEAPLAEPPYYVFNAEGGGFVIVAGDDAVAPILAYSRESVFRTEGMPENLADWMERLKQGILAERAAGAVATPKVRDAWERPAAGPAKAAGEVLLETALWGQGNPYNALCPVVDGGLSVTGCVATAISIIMRYYKYPVAGHGALPGYSYYTDRGKRRNQEGHTLGEEYQWDKMPLTYNSGEYSEEEAAAVARLMYDVGIMMEMEYNPTGSGALTHIAGKRLVEHMDFDARARMLEKGYFSNEEWLAMVKAEIDAGRPLLYSGYGLEGGHAFVADGYDAEDLIRFNWGWNGNNNGFFTITDVGGFGSNDLAVFDLFPDEGGTAPGGIPGYADIQSTSTTIPRDADFTVRVFDLVASGTQFSGQVAIGRYDNAGTFQGIVSNAITFKHLDVLDYQDRKYTCNVTGAVHPGDYLRPCYREDPDSGEWRPAAFNADYDGHETVLIGSTDLLGSNASLRFESGTRVLTVVSVFPDITCTVTDRDGNDCSGRITAVANASGGTTFTIPTDDLPGGTYTLTLSYGDLFSTVQIAL